ncbi:zinc ribbon domain-containing protein [Haloterrigena alkaliphila]|uniref:Zinc ribbon domain-containing protein n=1 Tax=Haloterrigena alkaliphila TaxID=2816475 RepID=A0A8A2V7S8_9EURY|nr:zinc ribbon domain-containing protein [Haloterrigena alkaliphila]QSW97969.1 zinc ribbon domain-containing protein [Haloterrigena alkaliphila]
MTWLRAVAAGVLSLLLPGAGHALLRDWLRALLFAGLYFVAIWFFYPVQDLATDGGSLSEMMSESMDVAANVDPMAQMTIMLVVAIATFDAILRAFGFPPTANASSDGPTCPECGKEVDADLEFCHWCTTRLEPMTAETDEAEAEETARS